MTSYVIDDHEFEVLRGRTILIIGAATGIGQATVRLAHRKIPHTKPACILSSMVLILKSSGVVDHGANVAIGDWDVDKGKRLAEELNEYSDLPFLRKKHMQG
jgi:NADPH:quinone reductase-like Zn-dependent oxidoreductase